MINIYIKIRKVFVKFISIEIDVIDNYIKSHVVLKTVRSIMAESINGRRYIKSLNNIKYIKEYCSIYIKIIKFDHLY